MHTKLVAIVGMFALAWSPLTQAAPSAAELEAAGNLFAITCSSSFCHGEGGIGARGPSLRNRNFPPNYVRDTIMNGRSGTPMPSFKDALSPAEIAMIVGYVASLSPENQSADASSGDTAVTAAPIAMPLSDQALRGQDLFFDDTHENSCAACHSYGAKGGLVGPDLSKIAGKPASAIYRSIVKPTPSDGYPGIVVTTKDGHQFAGIKHDQGKEQVSLFDVSSAPPVLRNFYFADGVKVEQAAGALYKHDLSGLAKTDIADMIAFLKSSTGEGKPVTPQELGLQ
jgi:putative heme-binding domain-containing protein